MGRYRLPTLVTDADVIHRRRIHLPEHADVGVRSSAPCPYRSPTWIGSASTKGRR